MSDDGGTLQRVDQVDPLPLLRAFHRDGEIDSPRAVLPRVQWVRREHPETTIATELAHLDDRLVVVKATVTLPTGAAASDHAAEARPPDDDPGAAIELAETRAIGRALDLLGYALVAVEAEARDAGQRSDTASISPVPAATSPAPREISPSEPPEPPELSTPTSGRWSTTTRDPRPVDGGGRPPVVDAVRRIRRPEQPDVPERATPTPVEPPAEPERQGPQRPPITLRPRSPTVPSAPGNGPAASGSDSDEEPPLEDYSWSAFWRWARQHGYSSHNDLERAIGRPTQGLTPGQIRTALRDAGIGE